jgi:Fungal cellulose binding domain
MHVLTNSTLLLLLLATTTGGGSKCSSRPGSANGCCQRNIKLANKSCDETGGKAPCLIKKATTTAAAAPAPAAKDSSSGDCVADNWKQCGGEGYSGCTKCGDGFYCKDLSWNWHQCVNN